MDLYDVLLVAAGGGAAACINLLYRLIFKKKGMSQLEVYAANMIQDENILLKTQINTIQQYNAKMVQKVAEQEMEIFQLKHQVEMLQFMPFNIPLPLWIKDQSGKMVFISKEYVDEFLKRRGLSKNDYLGKTDFDIWPEHIAEQFRENDNAVRENGKMWNGREDIVDEMGQIIRWRIMKFPYSIPNWVAGVAFPENGYIEQFLKRNKQ